MEKFTNLYLEEIEKQIQKTEQDKKTEIAKSVHILTFLEPKLEELKELV